jgi:hypothetical protein
MRLSRQETGVWVDRTSSGSHPVTGTRPVCDPKAKVRYAQTQGCRKTKAHHTPQHGHGLLILRCFNFTLAFETIIFWERIAQSDLCPYAHGSFTCPTFLDTVKTTNRLSFPVLKEYGGGTHSEHRQGREGGREQARVRAGSAWSVNNSHCFQCRNTHTFSHRQCSDTTRTFRRDAGDMWQRKFRTLSVETSSFLSCHTLHETDTL